MRFSQVIRNAIRSIDPDYRGNEIYTNKYRRGRSVKIYPNNATRRNISNAMIIAAVEKAANNAGVMMTTTQRESTGRFDGGTIIFSYPLDA